MEILRTKHVMPKGFELGTTLHWPNRSITCHVLVNPHAFLLSILIDLQEKGKKVLCR